MKQLTLILFLLLSVTATAQTQPDSTSAGKGKAGLKGTVATDSLPPMADTLALDTPVVDTLAASSGKGGIKGTDGSKGKPPKPKKVKQPKLKADKETEKHDPNIALRRSLILPGWGQIYNRKAWKLPFLYGGFAATTFFIIDNHRSYRQNREIVICKQDSNCVDPSPDFSLDNIITVRDFHRRWRDLNVIFTALLYTIQVIDAYVDAHLMEFDISNDLSMKVMPGLQVDPLRRDRLRVGATLSFKLRR